MKSKLVRFALIPAIVGTALSSQAAVGTLSGPFIYRNLQVFLVHGETRLDDRQYATLSEALQKGVAVVKETGNVQQLSIENLSKDLTVFLQSGDIVKGGRQDRTIREDLVLPPLSGPVPLAALCVEQGRWTRRGEESPAAFSGNTKSLTSRKQKLAARYGVNQSEVWAGVAEQQAQLSDNLSTLAGRRVDTRSPASASSLQLTLENKELADVSKQYLDQLRPVIEGKSDVMGFVYAINGQINSAEVYNHQRLFRALWPKLLEAAVTEAIAEYKKGHPAPAVDATEVKRFFETAVTGTVEERPVWKSTRVKVYTTASTIFFETLDLEAGGEWIHKSFINQGPEKITVPLDGNTRPTPRPRSRLR